MKVAMLNTFDSGGGAARSAYRLHQGLLRQGVASHFVSQYNKSTDPEIICGNGRTDKLIALLRPIADALPLNLHPKRDKRKPFSTAYVPVAQRVRKATVEADIIHLHWVTHGFVNIPFLTKARRPVVWTLHDSWPFTGGCHLPGECRRYRDACGFCPQLGSSREWDLTRLNWRRKTRAWQDANMVVVAPSNWLAECARSSSLFSGHRVEVIPNGIDVEVFKPLNRSQCRNILNLPQNKNLILFGAMGALSDENKGFELLRQAVATLPKQVAGKENMLVVFGARPTELPNLNVEVHFMGTMTDDIALSVLYASADVMVVPSKQENLPNTIMEAMACGTPVVAFQTGGIPDLIEHQHSGYLASAFDIEDLARGIAWLIDENDHANTFGIRCRQKVEREFALDLVTSRYIELYSELAG
jgi:glycosyltransferase involved in cell wall biosynthesis